MFADDYFSFSFAEMVGTLVTIVGIWLVVSQLRQSRIAAQMEGILEISSWFNEIGPALDFVDDLGSSNKWNGLDGTQAYDFLTKSKSSRRLYREIVVFYESLATLVRSGILNRKLAYNNFGPMSIKRWKTLEKAIIINRKIVGEESLYKDWDWMAGDFEKYRR